MIVPSRIVVVGLAIAVALVGCSRERLGSGGASGMTHDGDAYSGPTFEADVLPIVNAHCASCHQPGGIAPFSLGTYEEARPVAQQIAFAVVSKRMPPWPEEETDRCRPRFGFKGDLRLSPREVKTIVDWAENGAPRGGPGGPGFQPPPEPQLSGVDRAIQLPGWDTSGATDQYRCFVIDPHFETTQYVRGAHFVPGNPKVTHHAVVFLDPKAESAAKVDPATGSYDCFGSPGVTDPSVLHVWAPGGQARDLGPDVGLRVEAGSLIVVQVHYHPLGPASVEHDESTFEMRLAEGRPRYAEEMLLIGNYSRPLGNGDGLLPGPNDPPSGPEFLIPAGAEGHVVNMQFTLPTTRHGSPVPNLKVLTVATHMHYVGVDMRYAVIHQTPGPMEPEDECLVETPRWDFHWQRTYDYDVAIENAPEFRPGDKLRLTCVYDNSTRNPAVAFALSQQGLAAPRDVRLGEQTLDEMCLAIVGVAYEN